VGGLDQVGVAAQKQEPPAAARGSVIVRGAQSPATPTRVEIGERLVKVEHNQRLLALVAARRRLGRCQVLRRLLLLLLLRLRDRGRLAGRGRSCSRASVARCWLLRPDAVCRHEEWGGGGGEAPGGRCLGAQQLLRGRPRLAGRREQL
jgi:hypothetical protein